MYNKEKYKLNIAYLVICITIIVIGFNIFRYSSNVQDLQTFSMDNENKKKYVYPLGNIIGIKANTDGVLVIGHEEDKIEYIGGLKKGDNIVEINGEKISNSKDITRILNDIKEKEIEVTFERNNKYKKEVIKTKYEENRYKLGLWVRDKVSGIGTMSFYDPDSNQFKAVGHAITDVDTNELLRIKQGYIYNPTSLEIIKGTSTKVGQIKGRFDSDKVIGSFNNNSNFGIRGKIVNEKKKDVQLIEVGSHNDVKIGDAIILFEDQNRNIISYDIKIESIVDNNKMDRDMVIKVVDEKLIKYTGGIIQGMSGAPIIQNNRIVGIITHVFKNNPKKGYGIFIDKMVEL